MKRPCSGLRAALDLAEPAIGFESRILSNELMVAELMPRGPPADSSSSEIRGTRDVIDFTHITSVRLRRFML